MKVTIVAVGKSRKGPETELFEQYRTRLSWPISIVEVEDKKSTDSNKRKLREAELILEKIPKGSVVIALDERGKNITSSAFAQQIKQWQNDGSSSVVCIIGGADGLDESIRKRAHLVLSLGAMTWPHMLVRALLAEQLYRASTILSGHPYHRE